MAKRNLDTAIAEIQAEESTLAAAPAETTAEETTPPAETTTTETPPPAETTTETPPPASEEPQDTNQQTPPQESPAAHAYRRQLEKQEARHKQELADLDAKWQKRFDEMKQGLPKPPAEQPKTRDEFPDDDSYIAYLAEQRVNAIMAERDKKAAEEKAEQAEQTKAQQAADAELQERRTVWQNTVAETFGQDTARRDAFMKRVAYCNERGLGKILENSPVAANYLMGSPTGVKVFEKLLVDVNTMKRVFNDQTAADPFSMFWELKQVESEVLSAEKSAQQQTQAQQAPAAPAAPAVTLPHGRPGRQAAGNAAPSIFEDNKAMLEFLRS